MTWAYGHVIVDEAQELSAMEWRMVFRRCPSRWMTLVGDTAQTSSPAGVDTWDSALEPFVGQRYRSHELTVNYRTPGDIMRVADKILQVIDPEATPAATVRESGEAEEHESVRWLPDNTNAEAVRAELSRLGGMVAVLTADNVDEVKGLEFDHVIVDKPAAIVDASPQGWQDLYVAVTRATQTLTVIVDDHDVAVRLARDVSRHGTEQAAGQRVDAAVTHDEQLCRVIVDDAHQRLDRGTRANRGLHVLHTGS